MQQTARRLRAFPPIPGRVGLVLIVAAVIFLLALFSLFAWTFDRQGRQQARLERELRQNSTFLATASPVTERIGQLEVQLQNAQQRLAQAYGALPSADQQMGIVERILAAAEQSNVVLTRLQAIGEEADGGVVALNYDLAAEGDVQALGEFARRLEQEVFPVSRLAEASLSTRDGRNRLTAILSIYGAAGPGALVAVATPSAEQRLAELQAQLQRALAAQDYEQALSILTRLHAISPDAPAVQEQRYQTHVAYGEYLLALNRPDLAEAQFTAALDIRPNGDEAALGLVKVAAARTVTPGAGSPIAGVVFTPTPVGPLAPTAIPTETPFPTPFTFPTATATTGLPPTVQPPPTRAPATSVPTQSVPTSTQAAGSTATPDSDGTATPATSATASATARPSSNFAFGPSSITYLTNCALTQIRGHIYAESGAALNGVRVLVWWDGIARGDAPVSYPSGPEGYPEREAGYWDMTLQNYPVANRWYVEVVEMPSRRALSEKVTVETNTDCTNGRQVALLDFTRFGNVTVGTPAPTGTATRTPTITTSPSATSSPTSTPTITPTPTPTPIIVSKDENPDLRIPDNAEEKALSTLSVSEQGRVRFMYVFVNISHPDIGDLEVNIISPTGRKVTLHQRGSNTGTRDLRKEYKPSDIPELRDVMAGEPLHGVWTLEVIDRIQGNDEGTLRQWDVTIFP